MATQMLAPPMAIADTGAFTVPSAVLDVEPDATREGRVRLWRTVAVPVAGAAAGSRVEVEVRNEVRFFIDGM